jgi:hypothetical protein
VLPNPFSDIGNKINRTLKAMVLAAAAGAAGVAALFFLSLGAFLWLRELYGTIAATLSLGGVFATIALVAALTAFLLRRRPAQKQEPRATSERQTAPAAQSQWWTDPVLLTTGVQVLRMLGGRRTLPLTIAALVAGFALSGAWSKRKAPMPRRAKPNGSGTFSDAPH